VEELDPAGVLAAVEEILRGPDSKNKRIPLQVEVNRFTSIAIFLASIVRRQSDNAKDCLLYEGEGLIHGIVERFGKVVDDALPKIVDLEISRRELDAIGNALIGWQEKAGKKRTVVNRMRAHVYRDYLVVDDVFVKAGGSENASLREDIKKLFAVSKKR